MLVKERTEVVMKVLHPNLHQPPLVEHSVDHYSLIIYYELGKMKITLFCHDSLPRPHQAPVLQTDNFVTSAELKPLE